jgi:hypothetical protein
MVELTHYDDREKTALLGADCGLEVVDDFFFGFVGEGTEVETGC